MTDLVAKSDLCPGDWVKMQGPGFIIYGKVTDKNDEGTKIVTSTVVPDPEKLTTPINEIHFVKIDYKEVPLRTRMWILNRISHPPVTDQ